MNCKECKQPIPTETAYRSNDVPEQETISKPKGELLKTIVGWVATVSVVAGVLGGAGFLTYSCNHENNTYKAAAAAACGTGSVWWWGEKNQGIPGLHVQCEMKYGKVVDVYVPYPKK